MNQLKFSLGPFELFASIIGGIPLLLAGVLLYHPVSGLHELVPIVQHNSSLAIAPALLFVSYILGGTFQRFTWYYFKAVCKIFRKNYFYFGNRLQDKNKQLLSQVPANLPTLDFEDRLVLLVREKIGMPSKSSLLDTRLTAYLREHEKQATLSVAELYIATHIMYRTWSFGFCLLSGVLVLNLFRVSTRPLELWLLPIGALIFSYLTFSRALQLKRWNNRELLLGFYFAASAQGVESEIK